MQACVVKEGNNVALDLQEFPDHRADVLARSTLRAVERFFNIPGVKEDYEAWLVEYQKRKEAS